MGLFDFFRRKKKTAAPSTNGRKNKDVEATRHCFVLCKEAEPGDLSQASRIAAEVLGRGYSATVGEDDRIVNVSVMRGGLLIGMLAHMRAPIPGGEAEEYADRNIMWPNGKTEAAQHRSHVIVTTLGGDDDVTPVESAIDVTRLALLALRLFDGLGVYWGNASVSNSREMFESFCSEISPDHVPAPAWLRYQMFREGDDVGLYTVGMNQFGLMDIEVDRSPMQPMELVEFVSNLASYLIKSGPVIADGNTVGGSEEERILVRHRPSMVDEDRKVYKIVFE